MKFKKIALHWQILIALILAVMAGYFFPSVVKYVAWMGEMFLKALKMIVIPLIFSSIVAGVTKMGGGKSFGRLGLKTAIYYLSTSTIAIFTGLFLVNLIKPGVNSNFTFSETNHDFAVENLTFTEIVKGIIPENIVQAMAKGDVLPIIFFALLFGYFITQISANHQKSLTGFFDAFFEVMMKMTLFIIKFTPIGIFAIVSNEVSRNANQLSSIAGSMALYMLVVISALLFHFALTLPLIVRLLGRVNPIHLFNRMISALLTAFSTSSSSATLPLTLDSVQNKVGVSNKISSFVLPLGSTVNMDGTALYECVAVLFIAQVYGIDLSIGMQMVVVATALLTSIGAAGIPMAGLVMISVILTAVHLPLGGIGLILAVDRILDMMRTTVNVWSDVCGTVVIAKSEGEELLV
jgi:Na+/H+-dicarboxylate symporter